MLQADAGHFVDAIGVRCGEEVREPEEEHAFGDAEMHQNLGCVATAVGRPLAGEGQHRFPTVAAPVKRIHTCQYGPAPATGGAESQNITPWSPFQRATPVAAVLHPPVSTGYAAVTPTNVKEY